MPHSALEDQARHAADSHGTIRVRGARENNLQDVSLDLPKRRITVFTGVSGSGKSSLVFGTIAAESQRLINETYTSFIQSFMPALPRPDVDELENLSAAIVVNQERMGSNSRSTLGTVTDAHALLRIIFSRAGVPSAGHAGKYSFNLAEGMCSECEGSGSISALDVDVLLDRSKSIAGGAIQVPGFSADGWLVKVLLGTGRFDPDLPVREFDAETLDFLLNSPAIKVKMDNVNMTYVGLETRIRQNYLAAGKEPKQAHIKAFLERAATFAVCPLCDGGRLNQEALSSRIDGKNIAECAQLQVTDLIQFLERVDEPSVAPVIGNLIGTLQALVDIGLGYLSLDRPSSTLSGGEAQRVKMVRHLGSPLSDVSYVFDEPTVGLHPHDIARMNELLKDLRDKGNTILVVEHKPEVMAIADHIVDIGPKAGIHGGEIVFQGTFAELATADTLTGSHVSTRVPFKEEPRSSTGVLQIRGASTHNLRDVDVDVPTGVLCAVTGVAGSGKSSLIHGALGKREGVHVVDQSAIRGSRRSNPATYTGMLDHIRAAFAKATGTKPALFSANSEGACPNCKGAGEVFTEIPGMAPVGTVCEDCGGKCFTEEVLQYRMDGLNIYEVMRLSVEEAQEKLKVAKAKPILQRLARVGLGYITLGQSLSTLSGGERQRIKLATRMGGDAGVFILDEPTTGLHLADVENLLSLLDELVDAGNSVLVIEHHLGVVAHADWVIDMGPGAGHDGGTVVFEGSPAELAESGTLTGRYLKEYVA
ncbi:ATP-binding cassette domain-containing protein [Arthrobacter sp. NPDC090010]|uniref:ATP-binding cassette domain-containing protein n=1 Tax=Arthrobacter sp. NPDC090010 TaxID=3363942 RepID=UPI003800CCCB